MRTFIGCQAERQPSRHRGADWGGYWGKQGPELLEHLAALFDTEQRMVFGATTFRETTQIMSSGIDPHTLDEWNVRTMRMPATVIPQELVYRPTLR
jgi:hypothetical protein